MELIEVHQEFTNTNETHVLLTNSENDLDYNDKNLVLLDSCAQTSIFFNKNLLTDIETSEYPTVISGISKNSNKITCKQFGKFSGLHKININYSEEARKNILSLNDILQHYQTSWDNKNKIFTIANDQNERISFNFRHSVLCNVFNDGTEKNINLTNQELVRAKLVKEISRRLGYESSSGLVLAIKQNSILNLPITIKDVRNADAYLGPEAPIIKGKSTTSRSKIIPENRVNKFENKSVKLIIDVMFINRSPYLISISDEINLTFIDELKGYNSTSPKHQKSSIKLHVKF